MKAKFIVLLAMVALSVLAADASAQSARLEVKGVPLGATKVEVEAALTAPACEADDADEEPQDLYCKNSDAGAGFNPWPDSFAGKESQIVYNLVDDKVGEITVAGLRAEDFSDVLDALTVKYGKPVITHPAVQNKAGASFENTIATWKRGQDVIVYDRYGRTMQYSWLRFTSAAYAAARSKWEAARAGAAATDL